MLHYLHSILVILNLNYTQEVVLFNNVKGNDKLVNILLFVTHASPKIVKQIMTVLAKYTAKPAGFVRQLYHLVYKWGMGKKVV